MTEECLCECMALLAEMRAGRDQGWTESTTAIYRFALEPLDDELGKKTVITAIKTLDWRPSVAEIRGISARLASPYPDDENTYMEIVYKARTIGRYGRPDPDRPAIRYEGAPLMSHEVVSRVVAFLGGWEMICCGESSMSGGLKKQSCQAHDSASRAWESEVSEQLLLPPSIRNPRYFPAYTPFVPPTGFQPDVESSRIHALADSPTITSSRAQALIDGVTERLAIPAGGPK